MTARELFLMARGRRRERRIEIVAQAALVWCLKETDIGEFIRCGELPEAGERTVLAPELQANVDMRIQEIMTTGRLVIDNG